MDYKSRKIEILSIIIICVCFTLGSGFIGMLLQRYFKVPHNIRLDEFILAIIGFILIIIGIVIYYYSRAKIKIKEDDKNKTVDNKTVAESITAEPDTGSKG